MEHLKKRNWRKKIPPNPILLGSSAVVALMMSIPIVYVAIRGIFAGQERWLRLMDGRIPQLLWNTLSLMVVVVFLAMMIGVILALGVTRLNVPGKKYFTWLLVMPLIIPPYVGAVAYIMIFGPTGLLGGIFPIYSFWGVAFVLTIFTYPYVYLVARASLKKMNPNLEEAARSLGLNTFEILWKVILPLIRPAMGAGGILVGLYVLSDFGAISILRYNTFTSAIYYQIGGYDNLSATVLSVVLIGMTLIVLWLEGWWGRRGSYSLSSSSQKEMEMLEIGGWKYLLLILMILVVIISVLLPLGVLSYWSFIGLQRGAVDQRFFGYLLNSLKVAVLAAGISMFIGFPVVYLNSRYPSKLTMFFQQLSYGGYALPGVIVALGIIFIFNRYIPFLYGSSFLIVIAYIIRFLPQGMQSGSASLESVSPRLDEAARNLGVPLWKVIGKVIFPLIYPGVFAGGALIFVSSMKELPATLLLRPPGFDTLAVRVWVEASEAIYHMAAPSALIIVIVSIIPIKVLMDKY